MRKIYLKLNMLVIGESLSRFICKKIKTIQATAKVVVFLCVSLFSFSLGITNKGIYDFDDGIFVIPLLFNGNISETIWKTANDAADGNKTRGYAYKYDALNRITYADYGIKTTGGYNRSSGYDISVGAYDKNGNITGLWRNNAAGRIDDLTYSYHNNEVSNRLRKVEDISGTEGFVNGANTTTEYQYDVNGNMTSDANKGIPANGIAYNHLNLPTSITIGGGNISYIYDATGVKLKKTVSTGKVTEYAGNYIYENDQLQFFSHAEGYVTPSGSGGYDYVYQYKDHLGNVRLSYMDANNNGSVTTDEVIEESNYYPFGLQHKGYGPGISSLGNDVAQRWKYNGIELEESLDLDLYEMDFRQYDPAIGRFTSIDPITHYSMGTYTAFDNNPVFWSDPSGANGRTMRLQGLDGTWHTLTEGVDYETIYEANDSDSDSEKEREEKTDSQQDPKVYIASANPKEFEGVDRLSLLNFSNDEENIKGLLGLFPYGEGVSDGEIRALFLQTIISAITLGGSRVTRFSRATELIDGGSSASSIGSLELLPMTDLKAVANSQKRLFEFEIARDGGVYDMARYSMISNLVLIFTDKILFDGLNYNETSNINKLEGYPEGFQNSEVKYMYSGVHYGNGLINIIDVQKIE
ncbi:hypothetical protein OOZ15_19625 [Galbibacter sp. EGI 63066]|uniref:RHS repeat domain-containing protein n=1 Tax=Galbibacter sp. EGI 63066 TaxID=2993559 RepID=UPI002248F7EF|nr:RHS repeat-associated core domain-containing protein [Galbibacter sp. EGI 63066]MCX2682161.1 hypothetical protein [Galbibacter sp. EGI 63066]